jgi:hypothetical protein
LGSLFHILNRGNYPERGQDKGTGERSEDVAILPHCQRDLDLHNKHESSLSRVGG